jgi:hypothetical protein
MSAPAGVPAPVVDILAKLTARTITSPDVIERFQTVGGIPMPIGPKGKRSRSNSISDRRSVSLVTG